MICKKCKNNTKYEKTIRVSIPRRKDSKFA